MDTYDKLYIDGAWVAPHGTATLEVVDSTTEAVMATIPAGDAVDVDAAVAAAKAAFPGWAATSAEERAKYLNRINEGLSARMDEIATVVSHEVGMPKILSQIIQVGLPMNSLRAGRASSPRRTRSRRRSATRSIVREPIGVVGCITPWNYPLHQIAAKVAFAMAAGCTVVLKPSEVAPINALMLARGDRRGRPAGRRLQPGDRPRPRGR